MARRKSSTLTELELRIMRVLWENGEATVEEIRRALVKQGRALALPSIRTMLAILQSKGYAARRLAGRAHVYRAALSQDRAHRSILRDLLRRAFDGSAALMVAALFDSRSVRGRDVAEIKRLIAEHEREERK